MSRRVSAAYGETIANGSPGSADATVTYTFDGGNRVTKIEDSAASTISRGYDSFDRLISETTPQGSIGYAYDAANRRVGQTVAGQTPIAYVYDNANRLTAITQQGRQVGFTYDAEGRRTTLTLPNGVVANYGYDAANQLISVDYINGSTSLGNLTYAYDRAGRRTQLSGSLANMVLPAPMSAATYDANNRLTNWNGVGLAYDNNGNLLADGRLMYSWDARGRLSALSGGTTASFTYDAVDRRSNKTIGAISTAFLYDGQNVAQELSSGTPIANLLNGRVDEVFGRTDTVLGTRYFVTDGIGSTLALTDSAGAIKTNYAYEPYGATTPSGEVSSNATRFTGREDDGTGLYYYRARYYHPGFMCFVTQDPIGFSGGINGYAYVGGNPVSYVDPYGLKGLIPGGGLDDGQPCKPFLPPPDIDENGCVKLPGGSSFCPFPAMAERAAPEKMAFDIAKRIEKNLDKDARRAFHDMDHIADRTAAELRADARELYEAAKKAIPAWLK